MRGLQCERDLQHGCDEGRRHAVARDVGNEYRDATLVEWEKVVKVARHRGHGPAGCGHAKTAEFRQGTGKDRGLDATRRGDFAVDRG